MEESKPKEQKPEKQRLFSQEQYDFLKQCSKQGEQGIKKWNKWRKEHPDKDILLEGADCSRKYIQGAYLNTGMIVDDSTNDTFKFSGEVHLENAIFIGADLKDAKLIQAHLEGAKFSEPLDRANLKGARLGGAYLKGSRFDETNLEGADFRLAVVDGSTSFWKCKVNKHCENNLGTNFEGIALGNVRIDSSTRQLLEYNIRRKNWEEYYKDENVPFRKVKISNNVSRIVINGFLKVINEISKWFIKKFWGISDYGKSAWRIIGSFLGLSLFFAAIYINCACRWPPGIVSNLEVEPHLPIWHYFFLLLLRPIYFSVVTMTTLGFGDMYANPNSCWGHILLIIQVILGYVILGALITRFAVLFRAGGPAGNFSDEKTIWQRLKEWYKNKIKKKA